MIYHVTVGYMKILHINTTDSSGAGTAARRLHLGLKSFGLDSKMLTLSHKSSDKDIIEVGKHSNNIFQKIVSRVRDDKAASLEFDAYKHTRPKKHDLFSNSRTRHDISNHPLV